MFCLTSILYSVRCSGTTLAVTIGIQVLRYSIVGNDRNFGSVRGSAGSVRQKFCRIF